MSENRKYYYLKLKENFFTSEKMVILESILPLLRQRGFQRAAGFPERELPEGSRNVHGG